MSTSEDISITATEATVAGSSVAITEAEEDAASFTQSAGGDDNVNKERMILTKESSVKGISIANDDSTEGDDEEEGDEEYAAPMHLHALRTPARLKGVRSRSSSRSRPGSRTGSRRNSSSPSRKVAGVGELIIGGISVSPSQSAESSLDGIGDHQSHRSSFSGDSFDPDILLDKLGFRDLDPDVTQEELQELLRKHISSNNSGLATLNERMSEETMDDVHAFQDLQFVKRSPPVPSTKDELDREDTSPAPSSKGESDGEDTSPEKDGNRREMMNNTGFSSSAVMGSMSYLMNHIDEGEEEGDEDDEGGKGNDIILEIPDGIASGGKSKKKRDSNFSTMAVAAESSSSSDDDDEDAEVNVPTSIMKELKISEGKRRHKHRDTGLAVAGNDVDVLEDDEQDGLEADLSEDEPR